MLPSLIRLTPPSHESSPEDIFCSSLGTIFTDDCQNQHGEPGARLTYLSSRCSGIELTLADPRGKEERQKFAHYLWNAGVLIAELVGGKGEPVAKRAGLVGDEGVNPNTTESRRDSAGQNGDTEWWWVTQEEEPLWNVQGETVLELGAGVGLGGIISALAGAQEVVISDYPTSEILSTINYNVNENIPKTLRSRVSVQGHRWGALEAGFAQQNASHFTRILCSDCLWMPQEHINLALSIGHFLSPSPGAQAYVIAGFHTGRADLASFFEQIFRVGLYVEDIYEMDVNGVRRKWMADRDGGREDISARKRWLVIARLKRRS